MRDLLVVIAAGPLLLAIARRVLGLAEPDLLQWAACCLLATAAVAARLSKKGAA